MTENREQELSSYHEFCRRIFNCADAGLILRETMEFLKPQLEVVECTLYEWLRDSNLLRTAATASTLTQPLTPNVGDAIPISDHPSAPQLFVSGNPALINFEESEEQLPKHFANVPDTSAYSLLLVPIVLGVGRQGLFELLLPKRDDVLEPGSTAYICSVLNQAATSAEAVYWRAELTADKHLGDDLGRAALRFFRTATLQELTSRICAEAADLFGVSGVYLWQKQGEELFGIAACGYQEEHFAGSYVQLSEPNFASVIAREGKANYANNYGLHKLYTQHHPLGETIQSIMGAPLLVNGQVDGVLVFADTTSKDKFNPEAEESAQLFADLAALAMHDLKERSGVRDQVEKLEIAATEKVYQLQQAKNRATYLFRLSTELSELLDIDQVILRVMELVSGVVEADQGAILLLDAQRGEFSYPSAYASHELRRLRKATEDSGVHIQLAERVTSSKSAIILKASAGEEEQRLFSRIDQKAAMAAPIMVRNNVAGVLLLLHQSPDGFPDDSLYLVEAAAFQVGMALNNNRLLNLIRDQAERLGELLRNLSVTAAQSQAILESIADGVVVVNATGHVTLANTAARDFLSLSKDQLLNRRAAHQPKLIALFGDKWIESAREWALGPKAKHKRAYIAQTLKLDEKYVSVHLSPVFAEEQFYGTVAVFRDVTHAVETDKAKNEFVSTVSHELRTPMTSIKGYTDLMLMGVAGRMTDEQQQYLAVIKSNADRVTGLVNDLLDVARMESGKIELDLQDINISDLITVAVNDHLRGLIEGGDKVIDTRANISETLPPVHADPERLMQVLTSLLDNAYNYTVSSGVITIDAELVGDFVQVAVSDTGIGIKEEHLGSIFERFYRVDDGKAHSVMGTGLGLYIVRSLVLLHGGTIEVHSELGKGSSFIIKIPAVLNGDAAADAVRESQAG